MRAYLKRVIAPSLVCVLLEWLVVQFQTSYMFFFLFFYSLDSWLVDVQNCSLHPRSLCLRLCLLPRGCLLGQVCFFSILLSELVVKKPSGSFFLVTTLHASTDGFSAQFMRMDNNGSSSTIIVIFLKPYVQMQIKPGR